VALRGLCREGRHHLHLRRPRITNDAEGEDYSGHPIPDRYAAGEIVGGLFYHNYASGTGLMSSAVFGRVASRSAARYAKG
jgi:tricarballylate dehydrogenase